MAMCLAIESSCDEFSMALLQEGKLVMVETLSQIDTHASYGGVIPELASREHVKLFPLVFERIGEMLNGDWDAIDEIAVTVGPGLSGSLLIGIQVAKTLALILDKPLKPIHHILGHVYSSGLTNTIVYPLLSLVVSGGHTELIISEDDLTHTVIGATRDDAVGEVYDKLAKKLGLPYPGGKPIDDLAQLGNRTINFTRPKMEDAFAFSFSGLKSAVINEINRLTMKKEEIPVADICTSFQSLVVEELIGKLTRAIDQFNPKAVSICGGVSANSSLRKAFSEITEVYADKHFIMPELAFCGDNAAMIGAAAKAGKQLDAKHALKLECYPNLTLEQYFQNF